MGRPIGLLKVDDKHGIRYIDVGRVRYMGSRIDPKAYEARSFITIDGGDTIDCHDPIESIVAEFNRLAEAIPREECE